MAYYLILNILMVSTGRHLVRPYAEYYKHHSSWILSYCVDFEKVRINDICNILLPAPGNLNYRSGYDVASRDCLADLFPKNRSSA